MTWVSYPGRKNGTAAAEEVDYAIPGGGQLERRFSLSLIEALGHSSVMGALSG